MMETQQQPFLDSPAIEQAPVDERVVKGAKRAKSAKARLFWPVVFSYLLSLGTGILVAYLVTLLFGGPNNSGLFPSYSALWKVGIPLSLLVTSMLGLVLPLIFARKKRFRAVFITIFLLFITLIVLVVLGLNQISTEDIFNSLANQY